MSRTLIVEDDEDLLALTAELLGKSGDVDTATAPRAALGLLHEHAYDLLITDLDVVGAGDGLMLAGVCRWLQPAARTVLVTGYPDFTRALGAMQSTLDAVLIKPVDMETLRGLQQGGSPVAVCGAGRSTLSELLQRRQAEVVGRWLKMVQGDAMLSSAKMDLPERMDHITGLMSGLAAQTANATERLNAAEHGRHRQRRGYLPHWVTLEISYLRRAIWEAVLKELLQLDLSRFPQEMFDLNVRLDDDLLESLRAFGLQGPL